MAARAGGGQRPSPSFALTEPGGGSDAAAVAHHGSTRGRRSGSLDGIEGVHHQQRHADHLGAHRRRGRPTRDRGHAGSARSSFRPAREGLTVGPPTARWAGTPATRTSSRSTGAGSPRITCSVNADVGSPRRCRRWTGGGSASPPSRPGLAQACLDHSLAYASERESFGKRIGSYQLIQAKLADMRARIEAARLLTHRAAWLRDQGRAPRRGGRHREAGRQRSRRLVRARGRADPRRATATSRSSPSRASTATRRCSRSARAPARSCGSSSRGIWARLRRTERRRSHATGHVLGARRRRRAGRHRSRSGARPGRWAGGTSARSTPPTPSRITRSSTWRSTATGASRGSASTPASTTSCSSHTATSSPASATARRSRSRGARDAPRLLHAHDQRRSRRSGCDGHHRDRRRLPRAGHPGTVSACGSGTSCSATKHVDTPAGRFAATRWRFTVAGLRVDQRPVGRRRRRGCATTGCSPWRPTRPGRRARRPLP